MTDLLGGEEGREVGPGRRRDGREHAPDPPDVAFYASTMTRPAWS